MTEEFAGWGMYDNAAVCLTCGHKHLIPKSEQVSEQPWLDWMTKHPGHETFIVPHRVLSQLGHHQLRYGTTLMRRSLMPPVLITPAHSLASLVMPIF